jgi:DNA-binding NarL/FixJ family response regulator
MLDKIPGYIIIAEDDAGHTAAISRALGVQMPACRLEFVTCLRDFRAAAARHSPDIALLDLNLRAGGKRRLPGIDHDQPWQRTISGNRS